MAHIFVCVDLRSQLFAKQKPSSPLVNSKLPSIVPLKILLLMFEHRGFRGLY